MLLKLQPIVITIESEGGPRRVGAVQEAARYGWSPEFVRSIDRNSSMVDQLYDTDRNHKLRKDPMTRGEVACYYGHRKAWGKIAHGAAAYRLVLEDDFQVRDPSALAALAGSVEHMKDWDIVGLSSHNPIGVFRRCQVKDAEIRNYLFKATGAVGYLLSRTGAQKLLRREKVFRPVDEDFIHPWELGLTVHSMIPNPIGEMPGAVSTLETARAKRNRSMSASVRGALLKTRWQLLSLANWYQAAPVSGAAD